MTKILRASAVAVALALATVAAAPAVQAHPGHGDTAASRSDVHHAAASIPYGDTSAHHFTHSPAASVETADGICDSGRDGCVCACLACGCCCVAVLAVGDRPPLDRVMASSLPASARFAIGHGRAPDLPPPRSVG